MNQDALRKYNQQKSRAKSRGIEWKLTFVEWCKIWHDSGKWDKRGRGRGRYCMCRKQDHGPYAAWNVRIATQEENCTEWLIDSARRGVTSDGRGWYDSQCPDYDDSALFMAGYKGRCSECGFPKGDGWSVHWEDCPKHDPRKCEACEAGIPHTSPEAQDVA